MYDEYLLAEVIKAYLIDGKSHRVIQREILDIPAPSRGGGFKAMEILHEFNIKGNKKGIFKNKERFEDDEIKPEAIDLLIHLTSSESEADKYFSNQERINKGNLPTEKDSVIRVRVFQNKLRKRVLTNYGHKCALCEIDKDDLLVCSHIVPWCIDKKNRLNPQNAISLCVLHDKLFDKGYFYLDEKFQIILTLKSNEVIKDLLANAVFKLPTSDIPNIKFLKYRIPK